jgi:ATP/maltotriose-dependent transcriptional regulator MalT
MAVPPVETKLLLPRVRPGAVARGRLDDLILRGSDARLTLVSAPAGFGKTTLLAAWAAAAADRGRPTAWVSLDEGDRQPAAFWTYTLLAVERAAPGTTAGALSLLQSGQSQIEVVLTAVINELSVRSDDVHLVFDDYHLADGLDVQPGMTFLLDHLPPQLHLVISTRADPALPLARLRARGELVEVRAAELRFTEDEAAAYLSAGGRLTLDDNDVAALASRTEGWIAALQLAALSLDGRRDPSAFVSGFAGDDRYVIDYLAEEVLDRQPDSVRRFLLDTSVLERLTGSLCEAVTEQPDGKAMLDELDRQNLFLVPLDDQRRWYRYHHLFGDVLRAHLVNERPDDVAELHRRASRWYDDAGEPVLAVRHSLAGGEADRAAELVELAIPELRRNRRESVIRAWIDDLPSDIVRNRPVLAMGFVGGLAASNEFAPIDGRLRDLEAMLAGPADELVVVDRDELPRIPGAIETYRAALALAGGDPAGTVAHADAALATAAPGDHLIIAAASALSGLATWTSGRLEEAHHSYAAALAGLQEADHIADVLGCSIAVADMELTLGRLRDAGATFERALALADGEPEVLRGTADMYVGLGRVDLERGDLAAAVEHLRRADDLGDAADLPQNPYRWRVAMALAREAEGEVSAAVSLLDDAIRVYVGDYSPNVQPVQAVRARVLAAAGDVDAAVAWTRAAGLSADDDLSYLREYEHVTLARVLLAEHAGTGAAAPRLDALRLLDRLIEAAQGGHRLGTLIELLALRAVALADVDDAEAATTLERAVALAEPEGYVRVFAREGPPMRRLLKRVAGGGAGSVYVRQLAAATSAAPDGLAPTEQPSDQRALIDPLSDREAEVLRLLASDLDGPSIARHLVVSLNTVRTHTKHIYTKLDVNSRRAAVSKAYQLNLLTGSRAR